MQQTSFLTVNYNIGNSGNYRQARIWSWDGVSRQDSVLIRGTEVEQIETTAVESILSHAPDVWILQEVGDTSRSALKILRQSGFSVHCSVDCVKAFALNTNRFEQIEWIDELKVILDKIDEIVIFFTEKGFQGITSRRLEEEFNLNPRGSDPIEFKEKIKILKFWEGKQKLMVGPSKVFGVKATDKLTGEQIFFINVHLPGYSLSKQHITRFEDEQQYFLHREEDGLADVKHILEYIGEHAKDCKIQIVGGDFNSIPERISCLSNNRFKVLKRAHFEILRSGKATNVNVDDGSDCQERELDFQFVRKDVSTFSQRFLGPIQRFFWGGISHKAVCEKEMKPCGTFEDKKNYDLESNLSDHIPVFCRYTTYIQLPLHKRVMQAIMKIFSFGRKNHGE